MGRLLISVRGKKEAVEALKGGAHIIDAEYPASALGTQYPLNIVAIRSVLPLHVPVATNIGEKQFRWATASQAALGAALAGADVVKAGLGGIGKMKDAIHVMKLIVRNVRYWFPAKSLIATLFADPKFADSIDPFLAPKIAQAAGAQGVLIDTFNKQIGKNLFDYMSSEELKRITEDCHKRNLEAWVAGSLRKEHLPELWRTGIDVVCVRGAACKGERETGKIRSDLVRQLVQMIKDPVETNEILSLTR